jgi:hypothetical protein
MEQRRYAGDNREGEDDEQEEPAKHRPEIGPAGDEVREWIEDDCKRAQSEGTQEGPSDRTSSSETPSPAKGHGAES